MAEYTSNLNLEKPSGNENFRRQVINDNMDKVDKKFGIGTDEGHTHNGTAGQGKKISYNSLTDKPTAIAPTSHKSSHATGGTDALSCADIGAVTQANYNTHLADTEAHGLGGGVINAPSVEFGNNLIKHTGKVPVYPEIEFTGMDYVNLLGKDGDCEDVSKWETLGSTAVLDGTNKVFGQNSIKIISLIDLGLALGKALNLSADKYYLWSAFLKNGNMPSGICIASPSVISGPFVTDTSKFVRTGIKLTPEQAASVTAIWIYNPSSPADTYAFVDGIMVNEITADEYNNLTVDQLLAKYPYVESYGCLTNPYFENRRHNLVCNGNGEEGVGYWKPWGSATITAKSSGGFTLSATTAWQGVFQYLRLKPNTQYTMSINIDAKTVTTARCYFYTNSVVSGAGAYAYLYIDTLGKKTCTFTTPSSFNNTLISIQIESNNRQFDFSKLMIVEGTTAPTEYLSGDQQEFVVEGQFTKDDKVSIKDGKLSGQLWWKHRTLYGKDNNWNFALSSSDYKVVYVFVPAEYSKADRTFVGVKYDGKVTTSFGEYIGGNDAISVDNNPANNAIYAKVRNADTGWIEAVDPNGDEVKAYMNGWVALVTAVDGRYNVWRTFDHASDWVINPTAFPSGTVTTLTQVTTASQDIYVENAGFFRVGDYVTVAGIINPIAITAIDGNKLTLASPTPAGGAIGTCVMLCSTASDTRVLNYCKSNVAPGYEGYRLHYKLVNPETITDANVHIHGDIWGLVPGDNYVMANSGMVLGEVANPISGSGYFNINNTAYDTTNYLQHRAEYISSIYRNAVYDTAWTILTDVNAYGKQDTYTLAANFDPNAAYTVDYQILKTLHTQSFGSLSMKYAQDVFTAIQTIAGALEGKQQQDSVLNNLIDLAVYEEIKIPRISFRATKWSTNYIVFQIPLKTTIKSRMPIFTFKEFGLKYYNGGGNGVQIAQADLRMNIYDYDPRTGNGVIEIDYIGSDTTIQNNLLNYGGYIESTAAVRPATLVIDCRERR